MPSESTKNLNNQKMQSVPIKSNEILQITMFGEVKTSFWVLRVDGETRFVFCTNFVLLARILNR